MAQTGDIYRYAILLSQQGEYYRAISEFHRSLNQEALMQNDSLLIYTKILQCYYEGEDYSNCMEEVGKFRFLFEHPGFKVVLNRYAGLCSYNLQSYELSLSYFQENLHDTYSQSFAAICALYLNKNELVQDIVRPYFMNSKDYITSISLHLHELSHLKRLRGQRSPVVAGLLSIVPGLGYVYTGYYQTAISSLILNGILFGSAYELREHGLKFTASSAVGIGLGWYVGSIYGSIQSAKKRNKAIRQAHFQNNLYPSAFQLEQRILKSNNDFIFN